ncbi:SDR family NAD(P)-dependent oxidoreductase [Oceanobacillus sp. HCA-5259]
MEKRTVVITGGNTGIGFKCTQNIARKDYQVVIACRNRDKKSMLLRK